MRTKWVESQTMSRSRTHPAGSLARRPASTPLNRATPSIQSHTPALMPTHRTKTPRAPLARACCHGPTFGVAAGVETSALILGTVSSMSAIGPGTEQLDVSTREEPDSVAYLSEPFSSCTVQV